MKVNREELLTLIVGVLVLRAGEIRITRQDLDVIETLGAVNDGGGFDLGVDESGDIVVRLVKGETDAKN